MGTRAERLYSFAVSAMILPSDQSSPTIARLASFYLDGAPTTPADAELRLFNQWIEAEFSAIPCAVLFWTGDISLAECKTEFIKQGTLNISTAHNDHPYLSNLANAKFRAVHDWHHIELGADDSFKGEWFTWEANNAPDSIQWILFSEIVLQAAAAIYSGEFPAQKLVKHSAFI